MFQDYQDLKISRDGRVLTITLNRPEIKNAVGKRLHAELARVFVEAGDDPDSDIIVLTGAGETFCAGGDMHWMREMVEEGLEPFYPEGRLMRRIVYSLLDCPKPVIARVNGDAFGFGASIALLCDIVICSETARFADSHVRVGLAAGDGGTLLWPQLIGFAKAKHYLLTGEPIEAVEAERIGLVSFVTPADELDAFVARYVDRLGKGAQTAIRYTKAATNLPLRQLFNSVYETSVAYEGLSKYTADFREGAKAFLEKRRPDFRGDEGAS